MEVRQRLEQHDFAAAFEGVLRLYSEKVFHLALSMLRDPTQAEDMAQDIFVKVWKGLPGYDGRASLSTWIYAIARNTCLTELKRRSARPTLSLESAELDGTLDRLPALQCAAPEPGADMDVNVLLQQLPEKYRRVITLFYLEQKSYEDVAAVLGLPLGTVKTFLFRAKKELIRLGRRQVPVALAT